MKIKTARSVLSITWVIGSVPLLLIVIFQTLNHVYGGGDQSWDKGLLWITPLLFPLLGTIIGSWSVGDNEVDDYKVPSTSVFMMTIILSVFYLTVLYGGVFIGATVDKHSDWDFIMRVTSWIGGLLQALISLALAKFFIENIRPSRNERKPTPLPVDIAKPDRQPT